MMRKLALSTDRKDQPTYPRQTLVIDALLLAVDDYTITLGILRGHAWNTEFKIPAVLGHNTPLMTAFL